MLQESKHCLFSVFLTQHLGDLLSSCLWLSHVHAGSSVAVVLTHSFSLQHFLPLQLDANKQVKCADGHHGQDEEDECTDLDD